MSSEIVRKLLGKLGDSILKQLASKRISFSAPIKITIYPEIPTGSLKSPKRQSLSVFGETFDLSETGVGFIVPSIRLKEHYLVGENRTLHAEIDLPNGKVQMTLIGVRYEQIDVHNSVSKYLIGAKILSISPESQKIYKEFYHSGTKQEATKSATVKAKGFGG